MRSVKAGMDSRSRNFFVNTVPFSHIPKLPFVFPEEIEYDTRPFSPKGQRLVVLRSCSPMGENRHRGRLTRVEVGGMDSEDRSFDGGILINLSVVAQLVEGRSVVVEILDVLEGSRK